MLEDDEPKQTIQAFVMEGEVLKSNLREMKFFDSDKNPLPEFNFDLQSDQTPEEFIKSRMEKGLGLTENPTPEQIEKIIEHRSINPIRKGKTVYFKDFIEKTAEDPGNIIDAEIIKEPMSIRVKNDEL